MVKNRKKVQVIVLLAVLIIGGYAIFQTFQQDKSTLIKVGHEAPDFRLANLQQEPVALDDLLGKPLVINFWGTFCEPCIREMPSFQKNYEKWKDQGVEIVGINLSEDTLSVSNYVKTTGVTYPILRDVDRKTEKKYGLRSYPTTFFLNADGTIQAVVVGEMSEQQINDHIEKIMSK